MFIKPTLSLYTFGVYLAYTLAVVLPVPRFFSPSGERVCQVLKNPLKNGGFESGQLAPWKLNTGDEPPPSVVLVPGYKSNYAAQMTVTAKKSDPDAIGLLFQPIQLCKGVTYDYSWSQYQVPNATHWVGKNDEPNLDPGLLDSTGSYYSSYSFDLYANYYEDDGPHYPAGQWHNLTDSITPSSSGTYRFVFEIIVPTPNGGTTMIFDNVVMTARSK